MVGKERRLCFFVGVILMLLVGRSTSSIPSLATMVAETRDTTVNPCDDLYKHACAGYIRKSLKNAISKVTQPYFSTTEATKELSLKKLIDILDVPANHELHNAEVYVPKTLYYSCVTDDRKHSAASLSAIVKGFGKWPLTDAGFWAIADLPKLLADLGQMDVYPLIELARTTNNKKNIPALRLHRRSFLAGYNEGDVKAYKNYQKDLARLVLGVSMAETDIQRVVKFETDLSKIGGDQKSSVMTVYDLAANAPGFDWLRFLTEYYKPAGVPINGNTLISVPSGDSLKQMVKLLKDSETLANYLLMQILVEKAGYLSKAIRDKATPTLKSLLGMSGHSDVKKMCAEDIRDKLMPFPVGRLFVQEHFSASARDLAEEIAEKVTKEVKKIFWNSTVLSDKTKDRLADKIDQVKMLIGYPNNQYNNDVAKKYFDNVRAVPDDFFDNTIQASRAKVRFENQKLQNGDGWELSAAAVTHKNSGSTLQFPAGMLQSPYFLASGDPMSRNYGGFGFRVALELIRPLLHEARYYWSDFSMSDLADAQICHDAFYRKKGNEHVFGANFPYAASVAESIALKAAFQALQTWKTGTTGNHNTNLLGLGLSHERFFYVSYAQAFCVKSKVEDGMCMPTPLYTSNPIRVNTAASLFDMYIEIFSCKEGNMYVSKSPCPSFW